MAKKANLMTAFTSWLTTLLASIIEPIIDRSIERGLKVIREAAENRRQFERIDEKTQELAKEMAEADTAEERWAILTKIRRHRAGVFDDSGVSDSTSSSTD